MLRGLLDEASAELGDALAAGDVALALAASRKLASIGVLFDDAERKART
jgi:hypothetical protein